jgi:hypothetical protein
VRRPAKDILRDLISSLDEALEMMKMDPKCEWFDVIEDFIRRAKEAEARGSQEQDVRDVCNSIRSLYGEKAFQDYSPTTFNEETGRHVIIPGTEQYESLSNKIYNLAEEIRTIGSY